LKIKDNSIDILEYQNQILTISFALISTNYTKIPSECKILIYLLNEKFEKQEIIKEFNVSDQKASQNYNYLTYQRSIIDAEVQKC
jgi:hypothetical protein